MSGDFGQAVVDELGANPAIDKPYSGIAGGGVALRARWTARIRELVDAGNLAADAADRMNLELRTSHFTADLVETYYDDGM